MNFNPRDQLRVKDSQNVEMLDARMASSVNKIIPNSFFKKKVGLEGHKAQKEDRLHDLRLLSSHWCS